MNNGTAQFDFTGHRVLMAEDIDFNAEILQELLASVNMLSDRAHDGKEALEMFEAAEPGYYCAIMMDIQMPIMDGYAAARAIRACSHPQAHTIPILAVSANALEHDVVEAFASGMNRHIAKPIDFVNLYRELDDILRNPPEPK